jgi:hypothetical protein
MSAEGQRIQAFHWIFVDLTVGKPNPKAQQLVDDER